MSINNLKIVGLHCFKFVHSNPFQRSMLPWQLNCPYSRCLWAQVRGQDRVGRKDWLDLWVSDRRCGHRLQDAQPWMAVRLLRNKARCLQGHSTYQPYWPSSSGTPMGYWLRRNLFLQKQCLSSNQATEVPTTHCLPKCWHLSLHLLLSGGILLPTSTFPHLRTIHCFIAQYSFLTVPPCHHYNTNSPVPSWSKMVWNWSRGVVAKRAVLGHWRH